MILSLERFMFPTSMHMIDCIKDKVVLLLVPFIRLRHHCFTDSRRVLLPIILLIISYINLHVGSEGECSPPLRRTGDTIEAKIACAVGKLPVHPLIH